MLEAFVCFASPNQFSPSVDRLIIWIPRILPAITTPHLTMAINILNPDDFCKDVQPNPAMKNVDIRKINIVAICAKYIALKNLSFRFCCLFLRN